MITLYTDGGARGNPGKAGAGIVIYDGEKKIAEVKKYLGDRQTNNWAEYEALVLGLQELKKRGLGKEGIEIRMDSELIVKQMRGEYKVKDKELKKKHMKARMLLFESFSDANFKHVPREENKEADKLVNEAIDEQTQN